MKAGDTFLLLDKDDHLWAVISDPSLDGEKVVIVLFVSWTEKYDQACVLCAGDHPFIKHDTCVQYSGAKIVKSAQLEQSRKSGKLRMKQPLTTAILERIRQQAEVSQIPMAAYEILRRQGLAP